MRIVKEIKIKDVAQFKLRLLEWAQQFEHICWLEGNAHHDTYSNFDLLLGVEAATTLTSNIEGAFDALTAYRKQTNDWILGYLSYDLKNDLENLTSSNPDAVGFADLYFFQPKRLLILRGNILSLAYLPEARKELDTDINDVLSMPDSKIKASSTNPLKIRLRIHKDDYQKRVLHMLQHIHRGDIYEANFCQEFYAEGTINPVVTYQHLNTISQAPFATFFKQDQLYLLCSSPERYLRKKGSEVISQPIKGTAPRGSNKREDIAFAKALQADPKERAENIMITDLVRNDLSKVAQRGSVAVTELCGIYPFKQVHQMISTVTAQVFKDVEPVDILKSTFPMGSMTGAPKVSAMQIIEDLEASKRGLYSGAVGYFTTQGDFDFNVVIRSILYNARDSYISFSVGSAITAKSSPEKEYEECLLKAKAMREVLG